MTLPPLLRSPGLECKGEQSQDGHHQEQQAMPEVPPPPPPVPSLSFRPASTSGSLVPAAWLDTVRVVGRDQVREAGVSLAQAFATDALSRYLVVADDKDDDKRPPPSSLLSLASAPPRSASHEAMWRLHVDIMTYVVAAVVRSGLAMALGPEPESVALWLPPGRVLEAWWTVLRSGLWRLCYQLPREGRRRYYAELLPLLHRTKMEVMAEMCGGDGSGGNGNSSSSSADTSSRPDGNPKEDNSYYLLYLGTKPGARRRGYAQRLLEHMFTKADVENRPIYLESSCAANNAFYKKLGFVHKRDVALVRGPVPVVLSIMVRMPLAVSSGAKPRTGE